MYRGIKILLNPELLSNDFIVQAEPSAFALTLAQ